MDMLYTLTARADWLGVAAAWLVGFFEAAGDMGITFEGNPYAPRSVAYDRGRDRARKTWARRYE